MSAASTVVAAPQHMQALAHANRVRLARASLKRSIGSNQLDITDVVRNCPWEVETMTIGELLRSQRRWGRTRVRKFLSPIASATYWPASWRPSSAAPKTLLLLTPRSWHGWPLEAGRGVSGA
jgi:hypothetical protein